jgi:type IV pilus assembly protein PilB
MEEEPVKAPSETAAGTDVPDEFYSTREAANFLGISPRRLHQLRRRGKLPATRIGWLRWQFRASDLMTYIELISPPAEASAPSEGKKNTRQSSPALAAITKAMIELGPSPEQNTTAPSEGPPIVRMANAIISTAIDSRASDFHLEPNKRDLRIRCRIDGVMQEIMVIPKHIQAPLIRRYKIMAGMDVLALSQAQSGTIRIKHSNNDYNMRVSSIPSLWGEHLTVHIVGREAVVETRRIGFTESAYFQAENLYARSSGLVLIAGPGKSGTTTTAFSILNRLNTIEREIYTIEDFLEYELTGITQTHIENNPHLSLPDALEGVLRHRPDVLLLGNLRDAEGAAGAVRAVNGGALVLAVINAPDAVSTLRRLQDFGLTPDTIARTVNGVIAQRLVRILCHECKETYSAPANQVAEYYPPGSYPEDFVTLYKASGCDACHGRGYFRRTGLFEVLEMNWELQELLRRGAPASDLYDAARANGMSPLPYDGYTKALAGLTTLEEINKALS